MPGATASRLESAQKTALFFPIQRCGVLLFSRPTVRLARTGPLPSTVRRSKTMQSRKGLVRGTRGGQLMVDGYTLDVRFNVGGLSTFMPYQSCLLNISSARCWITGLWLRTRADAMEAFNNVSPSAAYRQHHVRIMVSLVQISVTHDILPLLLLL